MKSYDKLTLALAQITKKEQLVEIFLGLKESDEEQGLNIESAFEKIQKPLVDAAMRWQQTVANENKTVTQEQVTRIREILEMTKLRYQAETATYLSYLDAMSRRRAELEGFANEVEEKFRDDIFDGISCFMDEKRNILLERIVRETNPQARLMDAYVKPITKFIRWLVVKVTKKKTKVTEWDQSLVERVLELELGEESVKVAMARVLDEAQSAYESAWQKKLQESPPDLQVLKAFTSVVSSVQSVDAGLNTEISTIASVGGLGGTLAGTFGLAATSYLTLNYALVHVFPPAVLATLVITAATFALTHKSAVADRQKQVEKVVRHYYMSLIAVAFTTPMKESENMKILQLIRRASKSKIEQYSNHWEECIAGKLRHADYQDLTRAIAQHVEAINKAIQICENNDEGGDLDKVETTTPILKSSAPKTLQCKKKASWLVRLRQVFDATKGEE